MTLVPAAQFHLSDALLRTTGKLSRRRRVLVVLSYLGGAAFAVLGLLTNWVVGEPSAVATTPSLTGGPLFPLFTACLLYTSVA